ncbi:hypothetical protein L596_014269 [Steinernema carpocapsae]|uniref:Uncharacterized protein n=1 Tax=Steinernema carpocapsae TaxID=34508 RepID=A0A4U5NBE2_STECR|nr:hypothetical protein L596_014269 [Steinernema carpocapsae]
MTNTNPGKLPAELEGLEYNAKRKEEDGRQRNRSRLEYHRTTTKETIPEKTAKWIDLKKAKGYPNWEQSLTGQNPQDKDRFRCSCSSCFFDVFRCFCKPHFFPTTLSLPFAVIASPYGNHKTHVYAPRCNRVVPSSGKQHITSLKITEIE